MNYYKRALELKEETIANRRYLHEHRFHTFWQERHSL